MSVQAELRPAEVATLSLSCRRYQRIQTLLEGRSDRNLRGFAIDSGHYLAEEAPEATAKALLEFLA